jgi:hypothetical protein
VNTGYFFISQYLARIPLPTQQAIPIIRPVNKPYAGVNIPTRNNIKPTRLIRLTYAIFAFLDMLQPPDS